jgi:uncharacterized protein (TIGR02594 family)
MPTLSPLILALEYYGETPIPGAGANKRILDFIAATTYPDKTSDEVPWCSAFLVYIFQRCGINTTANAAALSWMQCGTSTDQPRVGDVVVLRWEDTNGVHAHVGLFIRETANGVYVLAGNQDNTVDIALWKKRSVLSYRRV